MRQAFTLIELSIVLVIIGLIVGGVLVGRDLIEAARVRSVISENREYAAAVNTFRSKYGVLPGDLDTQQATTFAMQPTSRSMAHPTMHVTHNNGVIETCGPTPIIDVIGSEGVLLWRDLSSAGMIGGNFTTATDAVASGLTSADLVNYFPISKLGATYWAATSGGGCGNTIGSESFVSMGGTNFWYLGALGVSGGDTYNLLPSGMSTVQAYQIDSKLDDGNPWTGSVRANNNAYGASSLLTESGVTYPGPHADPHCIDNDDNQYGQTIRKYNIDLFPDGSLCNLNIRF